MPEKKNTKELILKAALMQIQEAGYNGTSIRDIAKKVGVRESAIYNHFKSKSEIFEEIINKLKPDSVAKKLLTDALLEKLNNPELFLKEFAFKIFTFWQSGNEQSFIKIILIEQSRTVKEIDLSLKSYVAEYIDLIKLIFTEMIKHNFIKKEDPELLAISFFSPLFFYRITNNNELLSRKAKKFLDNHVAFFWSSVKK